MNTNDVAQRWAQLCREGKNLECVEELYADHVKSNEMPGMRNIELKASKRFGTETRHG